MGRPRVANILMWVGASHYATVTSFVREAARLGVSKRVAHLPVGVKLGRSLLFLAHDEAARVTCAACKGRGVQKGKLKIELMKKSARSWEPMLKPSNKGAVRIQRRVATAKEFRGARDTTYKSSDRKRKWRVVTGQKLCEACKGRGELPDGRIFGCCVVERLELLFDCVGAAREYKERREALRKHDRVPVTYVSGIEREPKRGCGYRQVGGWYLASGSESASKEARALAWELGTAFRVHGPLIVFPEPVAYSRGRFRGAKVIGKDRILKEARKGAARLERASTKRRAKKRAK